MKRRLVIFGIALLIGVSLLSVLGLLSREHIAVWWMLRSSPKLGERIEGNREALSQPAEEGDRIQMGRISFAIPAEKVEEVRIEQLGDRPWLSIVLDGVRCLVCPLETYTNTEHLVRTRIPNLPDKLAEDEVEARYAVYTACQDDFSPGMSEAEAKRLRQLLAMKGLLSPGGLTGVRTVRSESMKGFLLICDGKKRRSVSYHGYSPDEMNTIIIHFQGVRDDAADSTDIATRFAQSIQFDPDAGTDFDEQATARQAIEAIQRLQPTHGTTMPATQPD